MNSMPTVILLPVKKNPEKKIRFNKVKQIIKEDSRSVIERDGNYIIKSYTTVRSRTAGEYGMWTSEWMKYYNTFYEKYGGVVRVLEADENKIVMDYVEGTILDKYIKSHDFQHNVLYKAFTAVLKNLTNMADFSSKIDRVWFHDDAGIHNYLFDGDKFTMIDPDGFFLTTNPYPGIFVSPLHPLQGMLLHKHTMHEKNALK